MPSFDLQLRRDKRVRLLSSERQGAYIPADPKAIISASGSPTLGICALARGGSAYMC